MCPSLPIIGHLFGIVGGGLAWNARSPGFESLAWTGNPVTLGNGITGEQQRLNIYGIVVMA